MKLFGTTVKLIDKTNDGENETSVEVIKVVLIQCNLVHNQDHQKSEVLYILISNNS